MLFNASVMAFHSVSGSWEPSLEGPPASVDGTGVDEGDLARFFWKTISVDDERETSCDVKLLRLFRL